MIDKSNPQYSKIVTFKDESKYTIDVSETSDEVKCPFDDTMIVSKKSDGTVLIKKILRLKPF